MRREAPSDTVAHPPGVPTEWFAIGLIALAFAPYSSVNLFASVGGADSFPPLWVAVVVPAVFAASRVRSRFVPADRLGFTTQAVTATVLFLIQCAVAVWWLDVGVPWAPSAVVLGLSAFAAAILYPRLMAAHAALIVAPLMFGVPASLYEPAQESVALARGLPGVGLVFGALGATALLASGLLRVPRHIALPAAFMFALTAGNYWLLFFYRHH